MSAAQSDTPKVPEGVRGPTEQERAAIGAAKARLAKMGERVGVGLKIDDKRAVMQCPHNDLEGWKAQLQAALGSPSRDFADGTLIGLANVFAGCDSDNAVNPIEVDAAVAVLDGAQPKNEIEAMLVVQMIVTNRLAMRAAHNVVKSETIQQQDSNGLSLDRLTKAFARQVDSLAKLRRGGEQKVTVEHVHVYAGGQAVVGHVESQGARARLKNEEQPHAANDPRTLAFAGSSTLPSENPQREAVPVSGGQRQAAVPNARRGARIRRPQGQA